MADRFARLLQLLPATDQAGGEAPLTGPEATAFTDRFVGATFHHGVYRVHDATTADQADEWVSAAFPRYRRGQLRCFAYDWRGRQWALDRERRDDRGGPLGLLFDLDADSVFKIPFGVDDFHEHELPSIYEDILDLSVLRDFCAARPDTLPLARDRCVAFTKPLFLGGDVEAANMEVTTVDVHWEITGQLLAASAGLAEGDSFGGLTLG